MRLNIELLYSGHLSEYEIFYLPYLSLHNLPKYRWTNASQAMERPRPSTIDPNISTLKRAYPVLNINIVTTIYQTWPTYTTFKLCGNRIHTSYNGWYLKINNNSDISRNVLNSYLIAASQELIVARSNSLLRSKYCVSWGILRRN